MSEWRDPEGFNPPMLLAGCALVVALVVLLLVGLGAYLSLRG